MSQRLLITAARRSQRFPGICSEVADPQHLGQALMVGVGHAHMPCRYRLASGNTSLMLGLLANIPRH